MDLLIAEIAVSKMIFQKNGNMSVNLKLVKIKFSILLLLVDHVYVSGRYRFGLSMIPYGNHTAASILSWSFFYKTTLKPNEQSLR